MNLSHTEFWLYAVNSICVVAGILLVVVYWRMKDMAFLFAAIALIGSAIMSVLLPSWWPLATGWFITCVLMILVVGAHKGDGITHEY